MSNGQEKRWLLGAIHECQRGCGRAALSLRNLEDVPIEYVEHLPEDGEHVRMARGLLSALARFVEASDEEAIRAAFGAPGDYGYETPIGAALERLYEVR